MSIVSDIQLMLNDVNVFWPQAIVLDKLNEAQFWMFTRAKWQRTSAPITLNRGVDIIPIPTSILIPGWIEGTVPLNTVPPSTAQVRMFPTTQRQLEHFLRTWRGAGLDLPSYFSIWDATHLRVFPRPDQTYTFTLWGIGFPPEILTENDPFSGPSLFYLAVKHYTVGLLLESTRPDLADQYYLEAEKNVLDLRKQTRNAQSHNIRRLCPGKRFDFQQAGVIRELPVYYPLEA